MMNKGEELKSYFYFETMADGNGKFTNHISISEKVILVVGSIYINRWIPDLLFGFKLTLLMFGDACCRCCCYFHFFHWREKTE